MKKKKWAALLLSGLLLCTIQAAALAVEDSQPLPDSILYYGEVREVTLNEDGTIGSLHMVSARSGEFIMDAQSPVFPRLKRSRCRSSQEVNDSPTPFSALNYC